jgi:hypothetical protein
MAVALDAPASATVALDHELRRGAGDVEQSGDLGADRAEHDLATARASPAAGAEEAAQT